MLPPVTSVQVQLGVGVMGPGEVARPPPGGGGPCAPPVPSQFLGGGQAKTMGGLFGGQLNNDGGLIGGQAPGGIPRQSYGGIPK